MEKIKIQIKSWKTKKVLFEHEVEGNTIKITLEEAVSKGVDLTGADLHNADLRYANLNDEDLSGANLSGANLYKANLRYASLYKANLSGANLYRANLRYADLRYANLSGANLSGADLSNAHLSDADLSGADLSNANLRYANLYKADLCGVNINGANLYSVCLSETNNAPYIPMACPEEGSFIAWKKIKWYREKYNGDYLVKLEIPADARRSSATTDKCRCDKAKVLEITSLYGGSKVDELTNINFNKCVYKVGEMVYPDAFDENRWEECSNGIHFFMNKENAIMY